MRVLTSPPEIQSVSREWRLQGLRVGFVPTMGALHDGHLSLVSRSREVCDRTVVSIFVNPIQFGPEEDLDSYPRTFEEDCQQLDRIGTDCVFAPLTRDMYPASSQTRVVPGMLARGLCGSSRPGHFEGVTTVVAKLFHLVAPSVAFFGQKDYQQARILLQMVEDLNFDLELRILPTVRESDGLALSSRNRLLTESERREAPTLHRALQEVERCYNSGERSADRLLGAGRALLAEATHLREDYFEIRDDAALEMRAQLGSGAVAALAVRAGATRLIDNVLLGDAARRLGQG